MALSSIHNGRNFFSDYWLGSVMGSKKKAGPRLTPVQASKAMKRLFQLRQRVDTVEPPDLTTFRERFARPLLGEIFGFSMLENPDETRIRLLTRLNGCDQPEGDAGEKCQVEHLATILLLPNDTEIEVRGTRQTIDNAVLTNNTRYGFILTPSILRLVRKRGEGVTNAYLDFSIAAAVETDDTASLTVAYQILSAECLSQDSQGVRPIDLLEEESRRHSAKVSEDLKEAVFTSAELLIRGFLDDINDRPGVFSPKPSLVDCRDAALKMLYRLLFIFYAECRDERLQNHSFYLMNYSLEYLMEKFLCFRLGEVSGNRFSYWEHLLALCRIYDQGLPPMPGLQNIPPRGGTLFSEETPEGQFLSTARLPDRLVVNLLLTLATTRPRRGVGRERVSFRELAIEQLGAVYEGLLEYEPQVAAGTMIDVLVQGKEYVLVPDELCRLCEQKNLNVKGDLEIVRGTSAASLHPHYSDDNDEDADDDGNVDIEEDKGVKKGATVRLTRRLEAGDFFFVPGSARKGSGSYYTCEEIVQYLVRNALEDIVEGKTADEIQSLKVIDPACGSGHFLVGAARYLGQKLFEAYKKELGNDPPPDFYPSKCLDEKVRNEWERDGKQWCKRRIVEKCLYGVDLNPTAVQLAQVALWIESLAGDRPLSFFDHHIRCGNSLLGTWLRRLHLPPHPSFGNKADRLYGGLFERVIEQEINAALEERILIDAKLPSGVRKDTPQEYDYKADRLENAEKLVAHAHFLFDLRNAAAFIPAIWKNWFDLLQRTDDLEGRVKETFWWKEFQYVRGRERFFLWELEFPEIFEGKNKGFDAVLGNPPWEKVKPDRKEFYSRVDILIRAYTGGELDVRIKELQAQDPGLASECKAYEEIIKITSACLKKAGDFKYCDWKIDGKSTGGDPDIFKFFVERAHKILRQDGCLGLLVPSAIYNNEGCTGLRHLILDDSDTKAFFGFENRKKIFNIHSRFKFVCLSFKKLREAKGQSDEEGESIENVDNEFNACFMRHDVEELEEGTPKNVQVLVKRSELEKLSPGTLAFLEYRSERDREIILKMYGLLPGMEPRPLLGDQGEGTWNARFYTEFHMTNDRDLWTRPDGKLWTPKEICGLNWPADSSIPFSEVRAAMDRKGFWPLYEGKHIEQFLIDTKIVERWVHLEKVKEKYGDLPSVARKLVFRSFASNTNERTMMASVLPTKSCFCHMLTGATMADDLIDVACSLFNSLIFDYMVRLKITNPALTFYHLQALAIIPPEQLEISPVAVEDAGGRESIYESERVFEVLSQYNQKICRLYALSIQELQHILNSFPVFARKRQTFYNYLQERVKEWLKEES